jgi:hypothetical protein
MSAESLMKGENNPSNIPPVSQGFTKSLKKSGVTPSGTKNGKTKKAKNGNHSTSK